MTSDDGRSEAGNAPDGDAQDAAGEAAQNVVDEVTTWEYSGERETIEQELDEGLDEADVTMEAGERERVVDEIDDVKEHEDEGSPRVHPDRVRPSED